MSAVAEGVDAPRPRESVARAETAHGVAYYPGCSLHGTSPEYDQSLRAVVEALGIALAEIPDWNCCGASSGHTTDHLLGVALPARNLALAEAQGFDRVLAPCAACYNRLAAARLRVATEHGLNERMPEILGRPFANTVEVFNAVQLLHDASGDDRGEGIAACPQRAQPAQGRQARRLLRLPARPPAGAQRRRRRRAAACRWTTSSAPAAATTVDWNMKVECCGGAFSVSRTSSVVRLGRAIVEDARRNGAEAIVVACPLCHSNLDLRQKAMTTRGEQPLPILFITQVVGLALGLPRRVPRPGPALRRHRCLPQGPGGPRRRARGGGEALQAEAEAKAAARAAKRAEAEPPRRPRPAAQAAPAAPPTPPRRRR